MIIHVQKLKSLGKLASIEWIKRHNNHRFKDRISKEFIASSTNELQSHRKQTIIPPPPKKNAMDRARNSEANRLLSFEQTTGAQECI
jgi:hypothetical protein